MCSTVHMGTKDYMCCKTLQSIIICMNMHVVGNKDDNP